MSIIRLYHYTSMWHLPYIISDGALSRGNVPTTHATGFNAVWFTTDDAPKHGDHGLFSAVDKTGVRIAVDFDFDTEDRLVKWSDFAAECVTPQWARSLDETGGGKAHTWYFYRGTVFLDRAVEICVRPFREDAVYRPVTLPLTLEDVRSHYLPLKDLYRLHDDSDDADITLDVPTHPAD